MLCVHLHVKTNKPASIRTCERINSREDFLGDGPDPLPAEGGSAPPTAEFPSFIYGRHIQPRIWVAVSFAIRLRNQQPRPAGFFFYAWNRRRIKPVDPQLERGTDRDRRASSKRVSVFFQGCVSSCFAFRHCKAAKR